MEETWKTIEGYEGYYEVSNVGRVRSLERYVNASRGKQYRPERILKLWPDKNGYPQVTMSKETIHQHGKVHRLVAKAFTPNPNCLPEVNHKNGIKTDNRVENLEWCTTRYNLVHALKTGLRDMSKTNWSRGSNHYGAKTTEKVVMKIRELKESNPNMTMASIARKFKLTHAIVYNIIIRKSWKHI